MASTVITVEPLVTLSPGLTNTYIQEGEDPVHEAYIMVINIQRRHGIFLQIKFCTATKYFVEGSQILKFMVFSL